MPKRVVKPKRRTLMLTGRMPAALITLIMLVGLFVRLSVSHMPGYEFDVSVNQKWSKSAVELGLSKSYGEQVDGNMLPNYPPLSLMTFAGSGWLYRALIDPELDIAARGYDLWIRFPAILFDLMTAGAIWWIVRKRKESLGLLAAIIYLLQPAVWYDSAVWGQTDALYTLPLLLGLVAYARERMVLAGALLAAAVFMKLQAVAVFPLLLLSVMRPRHLAKIALGGCAAAFLVAIPFFKDNGLSAIVGVYTNSVGYYHTVSVGAYNFWWSILGDRSWSMEDSEMLLWGMNYRLAGFILYTIIAAWVVTAPRATKDAAKRPVEDVLLAGALLCLGFFVFNAQMHERYFFPFLALALPAAMRSRKVMIPYAVISFLVFMNLLGVLPWGWLDRTLYATFDTIDIAFATTMVLMFVMMAVGFNARKKS